jgi:hypothetical protein
MVSSATPANMMIVPEIEILPFLILSDTLCTNHSVQHCIFGAVDDLLNKQQINC